MLRRIEHQRLITLARTGSAKGQALVEFAVVVPLLFLLIVLAINFSGLIDAWITVANATRATADYAILGADSAGSPVLATSSSLSSLITAELGSLPNASSAHACVRKNNGGTYTTLLETPSGACASYSNPPSDSEVIVSGGSATYANVAVDITYTYNSIFSGSTFLGLPLTVLPSTVHQRAVMRIE